MDKEVYTAEDVAKIFKCSLATAYNKIKYLNQELIKKHNLNKNCVFAGRISKKFFDEIYGF